MTEESQTQTRKLFFAVRYDWTTKETRFAKYDADNAEAQSLYAEKLPDGVTLHRCEVTLSPDPGKDQVAREIYVESDYVDAYKINALEVLRRASPCRLFPVLTGKNSLNISYRDLVEPKPGEPVPRSQAYTVAFNDRKFRVTVEELPAPEPFDTLTHLSKKLDYIEKAPEMWGGLEAVELQYLMLLETYLLICKGCPEEFMLTYCRYCNTAHPKLGNRPYSAIATSHQDLVEVLKSFRASVAPVPV